MTCTAGMLHTQYRNKGLPNSTTCTTPYSCTVMPNINGSVICVVIGVDICVLVVMYSSILLTLSVSSASLGRLLTQGLTDSAELAHPSHLGDTRYQYHTSVHACVRVCRFGETLSTSQAATLT